ncbi:ROK family protein [Bacillota bacterium Meth-B3]
MNVLTLDLGGTAIKHALFHEDGRLIARGETASDGRLSADALLMRAHEVIGGYEGFHAIGVSTTGQVDARTGEIVFANENVPGYTGVKLRALLEARYGVPVAVENDVNAAALGEGELGAAKGVPDYLCLTYGTGVGGAIVIDGRLYGGSRGVAGEVGHMIAHPGGRPCACGQSGCYEQYASVTALVRAARAVDRRATDGRTLFELAEDSALLRAVVDDWLGEVALGLATLTHILNPGLIVLGGGVFSRAHLTARLASLLSPRLMASYRGVHLERAQLGNAAALYGALSLARKRLHANPKS